MSRVFGFALTVLSTGARKAPFSVLSGDSEFERVCAFSVAISVYKMFPLTFVDHLISKKLTSLHK